MLAIRLPSDNLIFNTLMLLLYVLYSITYSSPRYLSMLTNFTQRTKIFEAASISSTDGKDGAIRILLSFGSLPYGYVAPAPVRTTPASLHIATIFFAQPSNASNEMKYPPTGLIHEPISSPASSLSNSFRTA